MEVWLTAMLTKYFTALVAFVSAIIGACAAWFGLKHKVDSHEKSIKKMQLTVDNNESLRREQIISDRKDYELMRDRMDKQKIELHSSITNLHVKIDAVPQRIFDLIRGAREI